MTMNTYTSTVQAAKITGLQSNTKDGSVLLTFEGGGEGDGIEVDRAFVASRRPEVGSYYLKHANDDVLCLSAGAFEGRFTQVEGGGGPGESDLSRVDGADADAANDAA